MKVLIVDDSLVYQGKIKAALQGVPWLDIVGTASNGKVALEMLDQREVDLLTLDMEMPVLSGIDTLKKLKGRKNRPKVIVFSSATRRGSEKTLEALAEGANDFVAKPDGTGDGRAPEEIIRENLLPKIQQFVSKTPVKASSSPFVAKHIEVFRPSIVVIASSTGGPAAHDSIFRQLKGSLRCPILIAQHMPPVFTDTFARRLGSYNGLPSAEAKNSEILSERIYVAPGDHHMTLKRESDGVRVALDRSPPRNSVRPAADPLFESAAQLFGDKVMAFILTGMGEDGLVGSRAVKKAGGGVMIQDEQSSVVFGMPGAVQAARLADAVGDLDMIRAQLQRMVMK